VRHAARVQEVERRGDLEGNVDLLFVGRVIHEKIEPGLEDRLLKENEPVLVRNGAVTLHEMRMPKLLKHPRLDVHGLLPSRVNCHAQ